MNIRTALISLAVCLSIFSVLQSGFGQEVRLQGLAEGLWGERIDLSKQIQGLTLIQPFSPAT